MKFDAHLMKLFKFQKTLTKWMDGRHDRRTGRFLYTHLNFVCGGYNESNQCTVSKTHNQPRTDEIKSIKDTQQTEDR